MKYECMDCITPCRQWDFDYMLMDTLWLSVMPSKEGLLCLPCFQAKLGRWLVVGDLPYLPVNAKLRSHILSGLSEKDRVITAAIEYLTEQEEDFTCMNKPPSMLKGALSALLDNVEGP